MGNSRLHPADFGCYRWENAAMFPVTANIEVVDESWLYYQARKNKAWLARNIDNLELAAGWTLQSMDPYGRLWSDVYYEDQVIKDGRETEAQAFAAAPFISWQRWNGCWVGRHRLPGTTRLPRGHRQR